MRSKLFLSLILCLFLVSFISSASPFESTNDGGLQFGYSPYEVVKANTDFKLHIHVVNDTEIQTNTTTSCYVHLYNSEGSHIVESQMGWDSNDVEFTYTIGGGNFTIGSHAYIIWCNNTNKQIHLVNGVFEVTNTGNKNSDVLETFFIIFSIIIFGYLLITLLNTLAHFVQLDMDMGDLMNVCLAYFLLIFFHYFAIGYYPDTFILDLSGLMINVCGFTHLFIGILAFMLSITIGKVRGGKVE